MLWIISGIVLPLITELLLLFSSPFGLARHNFVVLISRLQE